MYSAVDVHYPETPLGLSHDTCVNNLRLYLCITGVCQCSNSGVCRCSPDRQPQRMGKAIRWVCMESLGSTRHRLVLFLFLKSDMLLSYSKYTVETLIISSMGSCKEPGFAWWLLLQTRIVCSACILYNTFNVSVKCYCPLKLMIDLPGLVLERLHCAKFTMYKLAENKNRKLQGKIRR